MTKRRVKGEGSVYQRKNGRFVGEYDDANGKRRYVTGKNKAEVRAKLREKLAERDKGIVVDSGGLTVEKYLDRWLEEISGTVRPSSFRSYETIVRVHLKPTVGRTKLEKLTALQLQTLYREKLAAGLSPRRVQYIHATISKALKDATRWQLVKSNAAKAATPPRPISREMDILTREQARLLLRTAKQTQPKMYALYALAVSTGARQGELLGLQRHDVDLHAGTLRVNRTVYNGAVSGPKTASGGRTIMLSKLASDALREHLSRYAGDVWVFATTKGTPISCHNLHNRSWKPLMKAAGLPHETRFHDLRHGAASMLLAEGVPVPVVSALLGHRDPSVTLRVYAKMMSDQQGTAALAMNGLLAEEQETPLS